MDSDLAAADRQPENHPLRTVKPARFQALKKYWDLYLIMLPGLAYFIIFKYVPMGGIIVAFQDFSVLPASAAANGWDLRILKICLRTASFTRYSKYAADQFIQADLGISGSNHPGLDVE